MNGWGTECIREEEVASVMLVTWIFSFPST